MKSNFWLWLKNPPLYFKVIVWVVALALSVTSVLLVTGSYSKLGVVAYLIFGLAGLTLAYGVYLLIIILPTAKNKIVKWLHKHDFTYMLLKNYNFRTLIFTILSFVMSVFFSVFNGYMGIAYSSIWYGALSAYYVMLAFLRGGVLLYHGKRVGKDNATKDEISQATLYRNSGIVLLVLNVALSCAIAQMIFDDAHFEYAGWTVFAYAAYAFYKITTAIINIFKANKHGDLTVQAVRNVNLADATVSILALQTALLATFNDGSLDASVMNTATGIAVSVFCIGMAIYMIVTSNKKLKEKV